MMEEEPEETATTVTATAAHAHAWVPSSPSPSEAFLSQAATVPPPSSPPSTYPTTPAAGLCTTPVRTPGRSDNHDTGGFSTPDAPTTGAARGSTSSVLHRRHHHHHRRLLDSSGLDDDAAAADDDHHHLPKKHEDDQDDRDLDCPICMSPLAARSVYKTRCSHFFHRSCMVETRAAHINGCPFCRGEITPGLTPFDACPGRVVSERDQIISRARAGRQAVLRRMQQQNRRSLTFPTTLEENSPLRAGLGDRFERAAAALPARPSGRAIAALSTEDLGHRIDHEGDLPHD